MMLDLRMAELRVQSTAEMTVGKSEKPMADMRVVRMVGMMVA